MMRAILLSFCLCLITGIEAHATSDWITDPATINSCKTVVTQSLVYHLKICQQGQCTNRDLPIPNDMPAGPLNFAKDLDITITNPGAGKCCIFDDNGNIKGALLTVDGDHKCHT